MVNKLVCAGNYREFLEWQRSFNVNREECLFIPYARALKGLNLSPYHLVILGTAEENNSSFPLFSAEIARRNEESSITFV